MTITDHVIGARIAKWLERRTRDSKGGREQRGAENVQVHFFRGVGVGVA